MSRYKKLAIVLVLTALLSTLITGCTGNQSGELTPEQVRQILVDSRDATTEAESFTFTMDASVSANASGTTETFLSADLSGNGAVDLANEAMKMNMDASFSMDMGFFNMDMEGINLEAYKVGEWMYQHISIPDMKDEWTKTPATHEGAEDIDRENLREQMSFFESPVTVELLPEEKLNGAQCHVIRFVPDAQKIVDALSREPMITATISTAETEQLEKLLNDIDLIVWIDKDTKYILKATLDGTIDTAEIEPTGAVGPMTDGGVISFAMTLVLADYDKAVDITLPAEAANAMEADPGSLFSEEFSGLFGNNEFSPKELPEFSPPEDFNPEEFRDMLEKGEFNFEKISELFENGDIDFEQLAELSKLFQDPDLDTEELLEKLKEMGIFKENK